MRTKLGFEAWMRGFATPHRSEGKVEGEEETLVSLAQIRYTTEQCKTNEDGRAAEVTTATTTTAEAAAVTVVAQQA